jgi:nicotinamide-nucleotide amidase
MFSLLQTDDATRLLELYRGKRLTITTAESCTGGLIAALLTEIAGSSDVFDRGFVTYSNAAQTDQVAVPEDVLAQHGAVSSETAIAMARGALSHSKGNVAVAVTGIAGPSGGSPEKPVGLVFIAVASKDDVRVACCQFAGERDAVRSQAVSTALAMLKEIASSRSFSSVA